MRDLYAETTARIVAALEQGTAPWVKPWSTGIDTLPMNGGTRRPYRGVNVLLLELEATAHGYPLQRWLTYRQAMELGGQVRKGEHGTTVVLLAAAQDRRTSKPSRAEADLHERVDPAAAGVHRVQRRPDRRLAGVGLRYRAAGVGRRGPGRGRAGRIRRPDSARRLEGLLPAGHRRRSSCHPGRRLRRRRTTTPRHCTSWRTGPPTRPAATATCPVALATTPMRPRS